MTSRTMSKVHVLGAGAMGSLLTHDLLQQFPETFKPTIFLQPGKTTINPKPITLTRKIGPNWITNTVTSPGLKPSEFLESISKYDKIKHIDNLIISTKAYATKMALEPFVEYITPNSNILIVQNGMGMPKFLKDTFWYKDCPNIYEAVATHGAYIDENGVVNHASPGKLTIAKYPSESSSEIPEFIQMILDTPSLNANLVDYNQFLIIQCEKLIVNCCINPLSALFDCFNGELLYGGQQLEFLFTKIINEAVNVLYLEYPTLNDIPESFVYLNRERLLTHVLSLVKSTSQNSSSMRQDIRMLKTTEIESINGYIRYLGKKNSSPVSTNLMLQSLINLKSSINEGINQKAIDNITDLKF